jgi:cell division protein FtsL
MDITQPWPSPTAGDMPHSHKPAPWARKAEAAPRGVSPRLIQSGDVELSSLGGYALMIGIMAACMLLSAWSRIDLRETAVALDRSEHAYGAAQAETSRLQLELSTLEDPAWLTQTAANLSLQSGVPIVDMTKAKAQ